jgi:signal transduction histidine kinase
MRKLSISIVALAALVTLGALRGADLVERRTQILRAGDHRAANLALILDGYLRQAFAGADAALRQVAVYGRSIGGAQAPSASWLPILRSALAGLTAIGSISVVDATGTVRHSTRPGIIGESRREYFVFQRLASDTADVLVADKPFQSRYAQNRPIVIPLGRRLTSDRASFDGIVVATFIPDSLRGFFGNVDTGREGMVAVWHLDGFVLVREPSGSNPIGEAATGNPVFDLALQSGDSGTFRGSATTGAPVSRHAYRRMSDLRLAVAVTLSEHELLEEWRSDAAMSIAVLALLAAMVIAFLVVTFRQMDVRAAAELAASRSQRLESLGQLTGGVAHDFNNLLTVIIGNVSLLKLNEPAHGESREHLDEIERAAMSASDLTRQLLAFARRQALQPRIVDANELVGGMRSILARSVGENVTLKVKLADTPCVCRVDPVQAETALLNLCVNGRDAMPNGGVLLIETAHVTLDRDYARQNADVTAGPYVMIAVNDNGSGIAQENLARVFEPFFTTKGLAKGTGLGLSMVYGFVKQSGGHIKVYSELGHGTAVKMYFPEAALPVTPPDKPQTEDEPRGDGNVVLLVEDEAAVRALGARILESLGYRVLRAVDGPTALAIARDEPRIDLLLTDMVLSGPINGREVATELVRLRPGLPVLYVSGYSAEVFNHGVVIEDARPLITKPYDRGQLARAVWAALQR